MPSRKAYTILYMTLNRITFLKLHSKLTDRIAGCLWLAGWRVDTFVLLVCCAAALVFHNKHVLTLYLEDLDQCLEIGKHQGETPNLIMVSKK